jgi:16S rRNA (cytidine1402-2'-O)-methyltransferase
VRRALQAGLARGERLKALDTEVARAAGWPSAEVYRLGVQLKGC